LLPTLRVKSHLLLGQPDAAIVWLAEELGAGLVVVGNRGLGGIRRTLIAVSPIPSLGMLTAR
jgi:nucleotide-binding universal stress UspA family protein